MKSTTLIVAFAATALLTLSTVQAAEKSEAAGCRAEAQKFCKDVKPGGGRVLQCLKTHENDLSPGCRERMAEGRKNMESFAKACKPDAEKLCKGIEPGEGRMMKCMRENKAQLSPGCREKIEKVEKRRK